MKVTRKIWNTCRILSGQDYKDLEKRYEQLTNLVLAYGGRIHGSQHNSIFGEEYYETIVVYFELPTESLDEFIAEEKKYK